MQRDETRLLSDSYFGYLSIWNDISTSQYLTLTISNGGRESIFESKKKKKISSIYLSIYLRLINGVVSRNKGVVVELSQSLLIVLQATRKISKCGYLFVAPGWDFSNPLNRTKVRKILGPIENLYPPAFHHAQWLYAVYTRWGRRGSDGETMERRLRSEMVRVWAIDHFRSDASGHELRVIDSLWSRDRVTRSIEPHNFLIIEKARITVQTVPIFSFLLLLLLDALKRSIRFFLFDPFLPSSNYEGIARNQTWNQFSFILFFFWCRRKN